MKNYIFYCALFIMGLSCNNLHKYQTRKIIGIQKPIIISADSSIYRDNAMWIEPNRDLIFTYDDLFGIKLGSASLDDTKKTRFYINDSTLLSCSQNGSWEKYVVYAGETLSIKMEDNGDLTFYSQGSSERCNDLWVQKKINENDFALRIKLYDDYIKKGENTLIGFYNNQIEIRKAIILNEVKQKKFLDSITARVVTSKSFGYNANRKAKSESFSILTSFYNYYMPFLKSNGLWRPAISTLLKELDFIKDKQDLFFNFTNVDQVFTIAQTEKDYANKKDSTFLPIKLNYIENNFSGIVKDYLLTKLMYEFLKQNKVIPNTYLIKYDSLCKDDFFKHIINNQLDNNHQIERNIATSNNDFLVALNNKKKLTIENVISNNKNSLILIDFWASWCGPCRSEMPYSKKLEEKLKNDGIKFIYISLDKDIDSWKKASLAIGLENKNSFLIYKSSESAFINQYSINTIPRYILINKNGNIIDSNAPNPSDSGLLKLIYKYLN